MDTGEINSTSFKFSDSRQERIYRRLLLVGTGPAAFYRDACFLMALKPPMHTSTHLISHLVREIESSLRDVIQPAIAQSFKSIEKKVRSEDNHRDKIEAILKGLNIPIVR